MAVTFKRQEPPQEKRAPGQKIPAAASAEHTETLVKLFANGVADVKSLVAENRKEKLQDDLDNLLDYRKKYYTAPE